MTGLRCAVAILPAQDGDPERLLASLAAAIGHGRGDFSDISHVAHNESHARQALAAAAAASGGFDWLLAVSAAETLAPDLFAKLAPALRVHDAIWGAASLTSDGEPRLERITRLAAQELPEFFHVALRWWVGPTHFVRPATALDALHAADTDAWYADYMVSLWTSGRAYKTAQSLSTFHAALPTLSTAERDRLIATLARDTVFTTVRYGPHAVQVPYTGLNPVIERDQMRGHFFEDEELRYLAGRLPTGMRILDVGANTGNHTAFFATAIQAAEVIPIEPHPAAVAAIRAMVAANGLKNVDLSLLGRAVAARAGRLRLIPSASAGLGATRFAADADGDIEAAPLDALVPGLVDFIKIDVEGMEMQVLAGAAGLIARARPAIFIEVLDAAAGEFLGWVDANGYRFEKLFPDKAHCNYLLVPGKRG